MCMARTSEHTTIEKLPNTQYQTTIFVRPGKPMDEHEIFATDGSQQQVIDINTGN